MEKQDSKEKNGLEKLGKFLDKITEPIIELINKIEYNIDEFEMPNSKVITDLKNFDKKSMTSKEKKELKEKVRKESLEYINKNYPKIIKNFDKANIVLQGIKEKLLDYKRDLEEVENEIEEIEELESDLEDRKNNLNF